MSDTFVVHLGGGVYLDAGGHITFKPPEDALVFPSGHPLEVQEVAKTLKEIAELTDEEAVKRWKAWGADAAFVEALEGVGEVASIVASVATVAAVIVALGKIFGWTTGNDRLSPQMATALSTIRNQVQGLEEIVRANTLIELHSEVDGRFDEFKSKVSDLLVHKPAGGAKLTLYTEMRSIVSALSVPINRLGNEGWASTYSKDDYKARFGLSPILRFVQPNNTLAPGMPRRSRIMPTFSSRRVPFGSSGQRRC